MSLRLRTINSLPWLVAITLATALAGVAQEPGNLEKRDLEIQKLPTTPTRKSGPLGPAGLRRGDRCSQI